MTGIRCSIIIPHYGTPDLLERCLSSVPSGEGLQTIVVDDCSPDSCDWLPELKGKFPWVEFVSTQIRRGAGAARNVGMDRAVGKWMTFLDADDYFTSDIGEVMEIVASRSEDVCFFRNKAVMSDAAGVPSHRENYSNCFEEYFKGRGTSGLRYQMSPLWGKFFRRSFIDDNGIRFEELPVSNDCRFSYLSGYAAGTVFVSDVVAYVVTERAESLTGFFDIDNWKVRYASALEKKRFLEQRGISRGADGDKFLLGQLREKCPEKYKEITGCDPYPYKDISALKGMLALVIFLGHAELLPDLFSECAVFLFFLLSGVCCTFGYWDKILNGTCSYGGFVWNRLVKFYPVHWLCLLFGVLMALFTGALPENPRLTLGLNAALLHAWIPVKSIYFSYNGVSWFLSCMVFFSFIFPPLLRLVYGGSKRRKIIFATVLSCVWIILRLSVHGDSVQALLYVNPLVRSIDYIAGIYLACLFIKKNTCVKRYAPDILVLWGSVSYEFFMVHLLCIRVVQYMGVNGGLSVAAVSFVISAILAVFLHHFFVVPVVGYLKDKWK